MPFNVILDTMNGQLDSISRAEPQLKRSEERGESREGNKAKAIERSEPHKDLRERNRADTIALLSSGNEIAGEKPLARTRVQATTGNVFDKLAHRKENRRVVDKREEKAFSPTREARGGAPRGAIEGERRTSGWM